MSPLTRRRWHATILYRTDAGLNPVEHDLEELAELHDLVERGPHWDTIHKIVIQRVGHNTSEDLTVEGAAKL
jgi:hypothetical protein